MNVFSIFVAQGTCEPQSEVVSIYGDDFKTPPGLTPYFIKVTRCVKCAMCGNRLHSVPVPDTKTTIKAVVGSSPGTLYEYSVYNHTTCKCGKKRNRDNMLYGNKRSKVFLM